MTCLGAFQRLGYEIDAIMERTSYGYGFMSFSVLEGIKKLVIR
jgi:hypothetical protein